MYKIVKHFSVSLLHYLTLCSVDLYTVLNNKKNYFVVEWLNVWFFLCLSLLLYQIYDNEMVLLMTFHKSRTVCTYLLVLTGKVWKNIFSNLKKISWGTLSEDNSSICQRLHQIHKGQSCFWKKKKKGVKISWINRLGVPPPNCVIYYIRTIIKGESSSTKRE